MKKNAYQLASMAGVISPDSLESQGALFLLSIAEDYTDRYYEGSMDEDTIYEIADNAVPIYTHERWEVFVDLAAYMEEDQTGFEPGDMTSAAGVALYAIAERLVQALMDEREEEEPPSSSFISVHPLTP